QAEDGIRDSSVTGVQTCALPISKLDAPYIIEFTSAPHLDENDILAVTGCRGCTRRGDAWQLRVDSLAVAVPQLMGAIDARGAKRSEERRVGKGGGAGEVARAGRA